MLPQGQGCEFYRLLTTNALRERSYENPTESNLVLRGYGHGLQWPLPGPLRSGPIGSATQREPGRQQKRKPRLCTCGNSNANADKVDSSLLKARGYSKAHVQDERLLGGRKRHNREVQLRIDSGDLQPERRRMGQALDVPAQSD